MAHIFPLLTEQQREDRRTYIGPTPLKPPSATARAHRITENLRRLAAGELIRPHRLIAAVQLQRATDFSEDHLRVEIAPRWTFKKGHLVG